MNSARIVTVGAFIVMNEGLLFLKRSIEPLEGEWWLPSGRVRRGEDLLVALRREVKEETGLELSYWRLINVYSRVFPERHDMTIAYLCACKPGKVVLNGEHSECAFFRQLLRDLHACMLEVVADSGWEKGFSERDSSSSLA